MSEDRPRIRTNPGVFARPCSFALNLLEANRTDTLGQDRYRASLQASKACSKCSTSHSVEQPCRKACHPGPGARLHIAVAVRRHQPIRATPLRLG